MSASVERAVPPSPYALLELADISLVLNQPLLTTSRIKYTCFDVSRSFIALGATSGGIYVFCRDPLEFLQLIPNKEGVITRLAVSTDEKYISFANGKGVVTVVECQPTGSQSSSLTSREHHGNEVTAMMWSSSPMLLYLGDDIGRVSVLQIPTFMTKTIFHSSSQVIMTLDSRVCQLDIKDCMLVVSTLTRCYICDTAKEQYRQIGQKLRDGEYGVCFLTCAGDDECSAPHKLRSQSLEERQQLKKYNVMAVDDRFAVSEKLANTLIYSARPSSRMWEAAVDGTVQRTHQYKQVLARPPSQIVTETSYQNENISINTSSTETEGQSLNFAKIYAMKNCVIFTYKKDAIYFLNTENVEHTLWFNKYNDIVDCKVFRNTLFLWRQDGTMTSLLFMKIDKYLVKCFVEEKYILCGELCALYNEYLLSCNNLSPKLYILTGLKDKLIDANCELSKRISPIVDKFGSLKTKNATQMESGIYVVDNTHHTQSSYLDENGKKEGTEDDVKSISSETMVALKGLSLSVTDKISSSKKKLKEKWDDLEEKMKNIGTEKPHLHDVRQSDQSDLYSVSNEINETKSDSQVTQDIIYEESSQNVDNKIDVAKDKLFKSLYQQYMLTLVKEAEGSINLCHILDDLNCDIKETYQNLLQFEEYCSSIGLSEEESKFVSSNIFLTYVNTSERRDSLLNEIIEDSMLYHVFVDSCVTVNLKTHKVSNLACECGYPLPYTRSSQSPVFSKLIDSFIERQWSSRTQSQCYEVCKKMPYLWRKILYLRRNEDLLNILLLLLQMLDESLLYSFLPQFTVETWDRAIQLYSILYTNVCLNCRRHFENVVVKEMLSWDTLGALLIKSVGGREAVAVMRRHSELVGAGELTLKFYHTCLLVARYEKHDGLLRNRLTDALYCAYEFEDARIEICRLLRNTITGDIKNTSLPLVVASKSPYWGLNSCLTEPELQTNLAEQPLSFQKSSASTSPNISEPGDWDGRTNTISSDCVLCGLPLTNEVLVRDGGLWVFRCGHTFHGACLDLLLVKLCPSCAARDPGAITNVPRVL